MSEEELQCVTVDVEVLYGIKRIKSVEVVFVREDTDEEYSAVTNVDGECTINICGSTIEELLGTYFVDVRCDDYSSNTNQFIVTGENNRLILYLNKLDECNNIILTNKNCKYFHHEPYMTPNNYDIYFDDAKIPSNIKKESPSELLKRLQRTMPLTDIIHLNLHQENDSYKETIGIHTNLKLKYKTINPNITESRIKLTGIWEQSQESLTKGKKTYEVYYVYNETIPIPDVKIKLTNVLYPLVQYIGKTNSEGIYTFENLPYGQYILQLAVSGLKLAPDVIEINEANSTEKILVGSSDDFNPNVNLYTNGYLSTPLIEYEDGEATYLRDVTYEEGELTLGGEDDDSNIFINDDDYEEITDFTEFEVNIIGINGEIVEKLPLNFMNSYTNISKALPLYYGEERIIYELNYSDSIKCDVILEYMDSNQLEDNEVILI